MDEFDHDLLNKLHINIMAAILVSGGMFKGLEDPIKVSVNFARLIVEYARDTNKG